MNRIGLIGLAALILSGCDAQSNISGTGVIQEYSTIEFVGTVLNDRTAEQVYDISDLAEEQREVGSIVEYEGLVDEAEILPAGVPPKIKLTKFKVIGIEN